MGENSEIRWRQRFENYQKALATLQRADKACLKSPEDDLYAIALIQSFKFTWELGWKVLKDYLNYQGVDCEPTPRGVIKKAFHAGILQDGQLWIDMLEARNTMSHVYDLEKAQTVLADIHQRYINAMIELQTFLEVRS